MLFFFRKMEQIFPAGFVQGFARGFAEGFERGFERGRAQTHRAWSDWNTRRQEAEAKGLPFNEPPPANPENGTRK